MHLLWNPSPKVRLQLLAGPRLIAHRRISALPQLIWVSITPYNATIPPSLWALAG